MRNKNYAKFLSQFVGVKGMAGSFGGPVLEFFLRESGEEAILEVGEDYVVIGHIANKSRRCIAITTFSVRYVRYVGLHISNRHTQPFRT